MRPIGPRLKLLELKSGLVPTNIAATVSEPANTEIENDTSDEVYTAI